MVWVIPSFSVQPAICVELCAHGCPFAWLPCSLTKPQEGAQSIAWFALRSLTLFPQWLLLSLHGISAVRNLKPLKWSGGWALLGRGEQCSVPYGSQQNRTSSCSWRLVEIMDLILSLPFSPTCSCSLGKLPILKSYFNLVKLAVAQGFHLNGAVWFLIRRMLCSIYYWLVKDLKVSSRNNLK